MFLLILFSTYIFNSVWAYPALFAASFRAYPALFATRFGAYPASVADPP